MYICICLYCRAAVPLFWLLSNHIRWAAAEMMCKQYKNIKKQPKLKFEPLSIAPHVNYFFYAFPHHSPVGKGSGGRSFCFAYNGS